MLQRALAALGTVVFAVWLTATLLIDNLGRAATIADILDSKTTTGQILLWLTKVPPGLLALCLLAALVVAVLVPTGGGGQLNVRYTPFWVWWAQRKMMRLSKSIRQIVPYVGAENYAIERDPAGFDSMIKNAPRTYDDRFRQPVVEVLDSLADHGVFGGTLDKIVRLPATCSNIRMIADGLAILARHLPEKVRSGR